MPGIQEFDTLEEAQAALKAEKAKPYGRSTIEGLFPGVFVTDDVRKPGSPLALKNPESYHVNSDRAVDIRKIPGMTFDDYLNKINEAGYDILEYKDEYKKMSPWATGPHWHVVIGDKHDKIPEFDTEDEAKAFLTKMRGQEVPDSPPVSAPINQDVPVGTSGTAGVDQTAITGREKAQQDDIQSILFSNKGKKWEDVSAELIKRYPAQMQAEGKNLEWYFNHYKEGGKTAINWTADKNRPGETDDQNTITVEGVKHAPYQDELQYVKDTGELAATEGFLGQLYRLRKFAEGGDPAAIAELERLHREDLQRSIADNPAGDTVGGKGMGFVSGMVGGAGPEYLLPGAVGETVLARLGSSAAINAGADLAYQGADIATGVTDSVDPVRLGMAAATGMAFQGVAEGLMKGLTVLAREHGTSIEADEAGRPYVPVPDADGSIIRVYDPEKPISKKAQLMAGTSHPRVEMPAEVKLNDDFRLKGNVESRINELTAGWKAFPEFSVYQRFDDLDDHVKLQIMADTEGRPEDVKAWVDSDGKIHAIADHLEGPEDVSALTFHEGLGHVGLRKQFGARLDRILEDAYRTNPALREEVDNWFSEGGQIPDSAPSPTGRATEEVLAERSEIGPFSATLWDRIKNTVKDFGRRIGLKNLKYSDREVNTILGMAHSRVINGGGRFTGASGNAYIRRVTHVSPHDFTNVSEEHPYGEFDHSKMGTGEGAQMYGWGTYLGENTRDVYYSKFANRAGDHLNPPWRITPEEIRNSAPAFLSEDRINNLIADFEGNPYRNDWDGYLDYFDRRIETKKEIIAENRSPSIVERSIKDLRELEEERAFSERLINALPERQQLPKTYEVDIHPHQEERMLHWDKGLSEQPPKVREALKRLGFESTETEKLSKLKDEWLKAEAKAEANWAIVTELDNKIADKAAEIYRKTREEVSSKGYPNHIAIEEASRASETFEKEARAKSEAHQKQEILNSVTDDLKKRYLTSKDLSGSQIYNRLGDRLGSQEAVSKTLLKEGVIGNKYEDGFSRGRDGEKSYNFVIFDEKQAKITNKYMRKKFVRASVARKNAAEAKTSKNIPVKEEITKKVKNFAGNVNLDKLNGKNEVDSVFQLAARDIPKTRVTHEDIKAAADDMGMSPKDVRDYAVQNGGARLLAMRQVVLKSAERVMQVAEAIDRGDNSSINITLFAQRMAQHRALQAKLSAAVADAGRALNALKIIAESKGDLTALAYMAKKADEAVAIGNMLTVEAVAKNLVAMKGNKKAQTQLMKDSFKPLPEDYFLSFRYNMMLYGIGTHVKNAVGNASMMYTDLFEHGFASVLGQWRRFGNNDRIPMREVVARKAGIIQALTSADTYIEAGRSFKEGKPTHQVSKVEVGHNLFSDKFGGAGYGVELPTRALSASDSFFRSLLNQSSINGLAHRKAMAENLTGDAYWDRVHDLIQNPTDEMRILADGHAALNQLVDDPSWLGKGLEQLKMRPGNREEYGKRLLRFGLHIVLPFTRVADRLFWSAVRRVPMVGFFDRVNLADWKAGGARRDLVLSRMLLGSLVISILADKYDLGELSGNGPTDYNLLAQKQAEGWRPNSWKTADGNWVSMNGMDTVSPLAKMVIAYKETVGDKGFQDLDGLSQGLELMAAGANAMADNTFLNQLSQLFGAMGRSPMAENNRENYAANLAKSMIPAASRQAAEISDGFVRDASGNGDIGPKIIGGLKASMPGTREELPIRHDVYGREITSDKNVSGFLQSHAEDKDPTILEIKRLTEVNGKVLVAPAGRKDLKQSLKIDKAPAEVVQEYQALAGRYIKESLDEYINSPEWKEMSDEEKIKLVKKIVSAQKKFAREDLFEQGGN